MHCVCFSTAALSGHVHEHNSLRHLVRVNHVVVTDLFYIRKARLLNDLVVWNARLVPACCTSIVLT